MKNFKFCRCVFVCLFVCISSGLTSSAFADYTGWYDENGWVAAEKSGLINPGEYTYRTYDSLTFVINHSNKAYGGGVYIDGTDYGIKQENGEQVFQDNEAKDGYLREYAFDASGVYGWDWVANTYTQIAVSDNSDFFKNLLSVSLEQRSFDVPGAGLDLSGWTENGFEVLYSGRSFEFNVGYYAVGDTYTVPPAGTPEPATMLIFGLGTLAAGACTAARRRRK